MTGVLRGVAAGAAVVFALAVAPWAFAGEQTLTFRSQAIPVEPYGVATGTQLVPSPPADGYVVAMDADVVDAGGNVVPDPAVMLHHVVFGNLGRPDYTCAGGLPERFYSRGEEHARLVLPPGFGYHNRATDRWALLYMLMNHTATPRTVYVRYTVRYVTGEQLAPAKPIWLDVRNCRVDPVFDVPGTGRRGSTFTRTADFVIPESGTIIAAMGHLHGGGVRLELRDRTCGTTPFTSYPTWGHVEPKPLLHEPGPLKMSGFATAAGIPVDAGERLQLAAVYDNHEPHTRVMGIMIVYLAPGPVGHCAQTPPLPIDLGYPAPPRPFWMPLPRRPRGPLYRNVRSTWVVDYRFGRERISIRRGTTFTWRFVGTVNHDVTLVTGPVGFSSQWTLRGLFRHRFTRPGVYRLFCSLHPTRMVQVITVR